jgi:hypothetical protein
MDRLLRLIPVVLALVLGACTSMGPHKQAARQQIDFGPPQTVGVCLYLDDGITEQAGRSLVKEAWRSEAPLYQLDVEVVKVKRWPRPAFQMEGIMAALRQERLEAPCDRILALIGRNVGDVIWGVVGPEVLGAVNDETLTHGYSVARWGSVNQLVMSPVDVTRHEIYHLLGCGDHNDMARCYRQISDLKAYRQARGGDFFPAWDFINRQLLASREDVNARLTSAADAVAAKAK